MRCIYLPSSSNLDTCNELIREDVLRFQEKRKVVLGDFNARVGKSVEVSR